MSSSEVPEKPAEKPAEQPAEKPDEKPDEKPTEKPEEKPEEKPAEKPEEKPAEKPTEASAPVVPEATVTDAPKSVETKEPEVKTDDTPVKEAVSDSAIQDSDAITPSPEPEKLNADTPAAEKPDTISEETTVIPIEAETSNEQQPITEATTAAETTPASTANKPSGFFSPYQPTTEKIEGQSAFKRCYTGKAIWISILILLLAILILIACAIFISVVKEPKSGPLISTECGKIEGLSFEGGFEFRGIPFAVPPVGLLRWKPPKKPKHIDGSCWKGTLNATAFGNTCFQRNIFIDKGKAAYIGSEDCLYLNVWTPTQNTKASLPVAVFVHGGSLANLNGNWPDYRPNYELAKSTDMVFVSMNYRLHAFGFMALDLLTQQSPNNASGNYGFMDIQMALQWVKRNIKNFGGDANQVSLFGHSSGATAVMALMTSPLSKGLFHRAWISSGSGYYKTSLAEASKDNLVFLRRTGCSDIKCLYKLSPGNITDAVPWDVYPNWSMQSGDDLPQKNQTPGAICVVDGYVIPKPPMLQLSRGFAMKIPLLIGSTSEEIDLFPKPDSIKRWNWNNYTDHVTNKLDTFNGNITEDVLAMYPPTNDSSVECVYTSLVSDIRINCPLQEVAYAAANSIPVYSYVVTYHPSKPITVKGFYYPASCAGHFIDIFAVFGIIDRYIETPSEADLSYQKALRTEILHFLKYGKPKSASWGKFPMKTAIADKRIKYVQGVYKSKECSFWRRHNFFEYSWRN